MLTFIIGTSGSGKTTFANYFFTKEDEIISTTTRPMRYGEADGYDYYFINKEQFQDLVIEGELVETTEYAGNYYGITLSEIEEKLEREFPYIIVDINGYQYVKEILDENNYPYHILYFKVDPEVVENRLIQRGDLPEYIEIRLNQIELDDESNKVLYDVPNCTIIDANKPKEDIIKQVALLKDIYPN